MTSAPDDDLLSAWLDGELPAERRAEVEEWLREHPDHAARVRAWSADGRALHAAMAPLLDEPVPDALTQTVWRKAPIVMERRGAAWMRRAAAVALFALGAALGWALHGRAEPSGVAALRGVDGIGGMGGIGGGTRRGAESLAAAPAWLRRAAVAHSVYVPETRHPVEVRAQEEHLSRWLTRRLDVPVKLFDLREQGFELVGGRLLPDAAGPSAQLMYQAIDESPQAASAGAAPPVRVTVYLRKPDDATPAAFRYERSGELGMFYWVEGKSAHGGPTGYALVGALPREKLLALAEAIYKQEP